MRALGVVLLVLAPALLAAPASALTCIDTEEWARWFEVRDLSADATVAVINVERASPGSVCGFGNAHALSGDRFAWVEPPLPGTSPDNQPWILHVETLSGGARSSLGLPAGRPSEISILGDRVLVVMQDLSFLLANGSDGRVVPVTGDLPSRKDFAIEGAWIAWPQKDGDHHVLKCRDATREGSADQATLALPSTPDSLRVAAAGDRWLVLSHATNESGNWTWGDWALDRASGQVTSIPLVPNPERWGSWYVEHELDGDTLYVQDNTGLTSLGRGSYHAIALPDGAPRRIPFGWEREPADGFDVDDGRIVVRRTVNGTVPPQPPRPAPPTAEEPRAPPCAGIASLSTEPRTRASPDAGLALSLVLVAGLALGARLRSRPSRP